MSEKTFKKELQRAFEKDRDALIAKHEEKLEEENRLNEARRKEYERNIEVDKIKEKYQAGTPVTILNKMGIISCYKQDYVRNMNGDIVYSTRTMVVVTFLNKFTDLFYHEEFNVEVLLNLNKEIPNE